ncbi:PREDICTED: inositol monophosphatase 2 [Bactrocera latifrons]|uniref:inositol monophosphatase 2 n=1 Tax=Bactrocera latifrons TaxID=174628 RepID=UPI0008DE056C|nr:PREDICTED: inositol monophosphatase 2 [Bactrocera latifrons]
MSDSVEAETIRNYYNVALELVMKSGPVACEGYAQADANYKTKSAFYDLVTIYDKKVEDLLIAGLQKAFPETKFIGEEGTAENNSEPVLTDAPTWIIDPIDGTTNFIRRFPNWCISVGLAINKELVVGIVYIPVVNEMYSAYKGHGAYLNGKPISVSKCTKMKTGIFGTELSLIQRPAIRDKHMKRLCTLTANSIGCRGIGSAAISLCYVARGSIDCFVVQDLQPWDIAGGALIIREAGGVVCHSKGGAFSIMKPDCIAAATPELTQDVIGLINEADQITEYQL